MNWKISQLAKALNSLPTGISLTDIVLAEQTFYYPYCERVLSLYGEDVHIGICKSDLLLVIQGRVMKTKVFFVLFKWLVALALLQIF